MLDAGIRLDELAAADLANARAREIKTGDHLTPRMLAASITGGFFGFLAWMLGYGIPSSGGEALADELGISPWAAKKRLYYAVKTHRVDSVRICVSIRIRIEAAKKLLGEGD